MKNKSHQTIYNKYKKYGNEFFINDNDIFVLNAKSSETYSYTEEGLKQSIREQRHNDYVFKFKNLKHDCIGDGFIVERNQIIEHSLKTSREKLIQLSNATLAATLFSVPISQKLLRIMKGTIKEYDLTHIQFLPDGKNKLLLRGFDIRRFIQQDFDKLAFTELSTDDNFNANFSIRREAIEKIPNDDYEMLVLDNDCVCIENDKLEIFIRTQNVSAPIIQSGQTQNDISLLLATNSY